MCCVWIIHESLPKSSPASTADAFSIAHPDHDAMRSAASGRTPCTDAWQSCCLRTPLLTTLVLLDAASHGPHLAWSREPDGPCRQRTAPDGHPEGQGVAPRGIVERTRHPGTRGPTTDRGQHQRAEDAAVVHSLEDLGRDRADHGNKAIP